jgi:hypothetical protein
MVRETVLVQVEGCPSFHAEVEINVDKLPATDMPQSLAGVFTKLPSETEHDAVHANFLLHTDRTGGGSSHKMWFHGNRTAYSFTMTSGTALDFTALRL